LGSHVQKIFDSAGEVGELDKGFNMVNPKKAFFSASAISVKLYALCAIKKHLKSSRTNFDYKEKNATAEKFCGKTIA
jgi:hypothetical protein